MPSNIQYAPSNVFTIPNFTTSILSSDMNYSLKLVSTDINDLPPVMDPKINKFFDKDINISDKDTSTDQN